MKKVERMGKTGIFTQLKAKLKEKLNKKDVNILFIDDDNTNTKEAKAGFDTFTKNKHQYNKPPLHFCRRTRNHIHTMD